MNAKIAAASAENAAQVAKLDAKLDRMMAELRATLAQTETNLRTAMADQLKWMVGLVCLIVALSMSTLGLMMRGYVDDAVRKAIDEKIQVQKSTAPTPPAPPARDNQAQAAGEKR
jgi:hypothetical protein